MPFSLLCGNWSNVVLLGGHRCLSSVPHALQLDWVVLWPALSWSDPRFTRARDHRCLPGPVDEKPESVIKAYWANAGRSTRSYVSLCLHTIHVCGKLDIFPTLAGKLYLRYYTICEVNTNPTWPTEGVPCDHTIVTTLAVGCASSKAVPSCTRPCVTLNASAWVSHPKCQCVSAWLNGSVSNFVPNYT